MLIRFVLGLFAVAILLFELVMGTALVREWDKLDAEARGIQLVLLLVVFGVFVLVLGAAVEPGLLIRPVRVIVTP